MAAKYINIYSESALKSLDPGDVLIIIHRLNYFQEPVFQILLFEILIIYLLINLLKIILLCLFYTILKIIKRCDNISDCEISSENPGFIREMAYFDEHNEKLSIPVVCIKFNCGNWVEVYTRNIDRISYGLNTVYKRGYIKLFMLKPDLNGFIASLRLIDKYSPLLKCIT